MAHFFAGLESTQFALVLLPASLVLAAWALQLACSIAAVEPPDFWKSFFCVVLVVTGNIFLRAWLNTAYPNQGLGLQLLAPLALTVAIVAFTVRTGPLSALVVTVCEGLLCAGLFICLQTVGDSLGQIY